MFCTQKWSVWTIKYVVVGKVTKWLDDAWTGLLPSAGGTEISCGINL
jgi:hypothetical protein